jgi:hypothetical protein
MHTHIVIITHTYIHTDIGPRHMENAQLLTAFKRISIQGGGRTLAATLWTLMQVCVCVCMCMYVGVCMCDNYSWGEDARLRPSCGHWCRYVYVHVYMYMPICKNICIYIFMSSILPCVYPWGRYPCVHLLLCIHTYIYRRKKIHKDMIIYTHRTCNAWWFSGCVMTGPRSSAYIHTYINTYIHTFAYIHARQLLFFYVHTHMYIRA